MHCLVSIHIWNSALSELSLMTKLIRRNDRKWTNDKNSLFHCRLQSTVTAGWIFCLVSCPTSRCVTLDGAAIMLQASPMLRSTLQWPLSQTQSACWTQEIQLADPTVSPPVHNDFAACIWLFFSLQHTTEEQTCGQSEGRKKKHLELLILCVKCVCVCFFFRLQGSQKARGVLCPVAESYCSLKQRDCGGIHLMLLIVWQSTPLI